MTATVPHDAAKRGGAGSATCRRARGVSNAEPALACPAGRTGRTRDLAPAVVTERSAILSPQRLAGDWATTTCPFVPHGGVDPKGWFECGTRSRKSPRIPGVRRGRPARAKCVWTVAFCATRGRAHSQNRQRRRKKRFQPTISIDHDTDLSQHAAKRKCELKKARKRSARGPSRRYGWYMRRLDDSIARKRKRRSWDRDDSRLRRKRPEALQHSSKVEATRERRLVLVG